MSASISGNQISLTRGDSLVLGVTILQNGSTYTPASGDTARFALKSTVFDDSPLINKQVDLETMTLTLVPSDTKELPFGTYVYDIELTTSDGYVDTFIGPAPFYITQEVH